MPSWCAHKCTEMLHHSCFLGGPYQNGQIGIGYLTPAFSGGGGGAQMGGIAMTPLHSWGSPTRGTNSEMGTSPVPSRGPPDERNCYVTHAFSVVAKKWDAIGISCLTPAFSGAHNRAELLHQNWLPHPCLLGSPQLGGSAMSPLLCRGVPVNETKPKLAASPLPFRGGGGGHNGAELL